MAGNQGLISGAELIDGEAIARYLNENCFDFILTVLHIIVSRNVVSHLKSSEGLHRLRKIISFRSLALFPSFYSTLSSLKL